MLRPCPSPAVPGDRLQPQREPDGDIVRSSTGKPGRGAVKP